MTIFKSYSPFGRVNPVEYQDMNPDKQPAYRHGYVVAGSALGCLASAVLSEVALTEQPSWVRIPAMTVVAGVVAVAFVLLFGRTKRA